MQRDERLETATNYQKHAEKALELGQEDLAREALNRKAEAEERIQELDWFEMVSTSRRTSRPRRLIIKLVDLYKELHDYENKSISVKQHIYEG